VNNEAIFGDIVILKIEGTTSPPSYLKGKCALGPFLSILVIECQHNWTYVNLGKVIDKVQIKQKVCF
jgi:hypothetical protein